MTVHQPGALWLGILAGAVCVWLTWDRVTFLAGAARTEGEVTTISSRNARCGGRRFKYDCTRYYAVARYQVGERVYNLSVEAGSKRGRRQPESYADYRRGSRMPVVYSVRRPNKAFRDHLWDLWRWVALSGAVTAALLIGSLQREREPTPEDQLHDLLGDAVESGTSYFLD